MCYQCETEAELKYRVYAKINVSIIIDHSILQLLFSQDHKGISTKQVSLSPDNKIQNNCNTALDNT